jgi:hypothetical protein
MKLDSLLILSTSLCIGLSTSASALDIFSVKSTSQKLITISDADFAKNPTVYKTVDPNFAGMKPADYSGVSIEKIASMAGAGKDDVITFLCKDNYIMAETIATLQATGALVANRMGGVEILPRSGGPITMVHKTTTTNDLYPWYISSIVVGKVEHPSLHITSETGAPRDVLWEQISKSKEISTASRVFSAPRGRRPKSDSPAELSRKISSVPLRSLTRTDGGQSVKDSTHSKISVKTPGTGKTINFTQVDGQVITKKYTAEKFNSLSLVMKIDGKEIQVRHGGPYIVSSSLAKPSELPIFYVSGIEVLDTK